MDDKVDMTTSPPPKSDYDEEKKALPDRRVFIAIDGSPNSDHAFKWYFLNVFNKETDILYLFHVVEPSYDQPEVGIPIHGYYSFNPSVLCWEKDFKAGKDMLRRFMRNAELMGCKERHGYVTVHGKPGRAIIHSSVAHKADLIVVGSRGLSAIKRVLFGSTSSYVIHHSHVPVTVVPLVEGN